MQSGPQIVNVPGELLAKGRRGGLLLVGVIQGANGGTPISGRLVSHMLGIAHRRHHHRKHADVNYGQKVPGGFAYARQRHQSPTHKKENKGGQEESE